MRVNHGCYNTFWFVQQVIHKAGKYAHWSAIHFNDVRVYIYSTPQYCYVTIDINATIFNQVLTDTTRAESGPGKNFLQPLTIGKTRVICNLFP
jgi:hypothetical protein